MRGAWAVKSLSTTHNRELVVVALISFIVVFNLFLSGYCVSRFTNSIQLLGFFFLVDFRGFLGQFPYLPRIQFPILVWFLLLFYWMWTPRFDFFFFFSAGCQPVDPSGPVQQFSNYYFFLLICICSSSLIDAHSAEFCTRFRPPTSAGQCKFPLELSNTGKCASFNMQCGFVARPGSSILFVAVSVFADRRLRLDSINRYLRSPWWDERQVSRGRFRECLNDGHQLENIQFT